MAAGTAGTAVLYGKFKKAPTRADARQLAKDISEEVDDNVRNGEKTPGPHSAAMAVKIDALAAQRRKLSTFKDSNDDGESGVRHVAVTVKAKTLSRLLAKMAMLAEVCHRRKITVTDNIDVWHDSSYRAEAEIQVLSEHVEVGTGARGQGGTATAGSGGTMEKSKNQARAEMGPMLVPIDVQEVKRDKISSATHSQKLLQDGSLYKGEMRDGRPHGFGAIIYSDTDPTQRARFAGEFIDGLRRGRGVMQWGDGSTYAGDWLNDKPSGFGLEVYPGGSSFVGQYLDDKRHGYGMYTFPSGAKYEGMWENGVRNGKALEHAKRGIYQSEFKEGTRTSKADFIPGQDEGFDGLLAKVTVSVTKGRKVGDDALQSFERFFQTKVDRGNSFHRYGEAFHEANSPPQGK